MDSIVYLAFVTASLSFTITETKIFSPIRENLKKHLTRPKIKAEASYFDQRENRSFERMYGWAWVLPAVM